MYTRARRSNKRKSLPRNYFRILLRNVLKFLFFPILGPNDVSSRLRQKWLLANLWNRVRLGQAETFGVSEKFSPITPGSPSPARPPATRRPLPKRVARLSSPCHHTKIHHEISRGRCLVLESTPPNCSTAVACVVVTHANFFCWQFANGKKRNSQE